MTNSDFVNGIVSDKKLGKTAREKGFIQKLTIKNCSSLSKVNICYYLKFREPLMHRQFVRINSQNPETIEKFWNDKSNPFRFAYKKWIIKQQFEKKYVKTEYSPKNDMVVV